jgi:hypothetical protein
LRLRDGFFAKLFKAANLKVGGGAVAVGAATALANFTFDVQSRPQLLEMGTVTVFMSCSEADNVAGDSFVRFSPSRLLSSSHYCCRTTRICKSAGQFRP